MFIFYSPGCSLLQGLCSSSGDKGLLSSCGMCASHHAGFSCGTQTYSMVSAVVAEKAMAPHSSTLAWRIPWMEEPGRLQSMGLRRVGHN